MKFENGVHKCLNFSFTGAEEEVRNLYLDIQKKFRLIQTRITIEKYERL